jgi:aromatic ring-opening dioxygenase LigB subunit
VKSAILLIKTFNFLNLQQMAAPNMAELIERYAEDKQLETTVVIAPHLIRMNINHVIQDRLIKGMQGKCKAPLF